MCRRCGIKMKIITFFNIISSLGLCMASIQRETEAYMTEYSRLDAVNLTQFTECIKNISMSISANITVDACLSPRTGNMIFDLFANITNYGENPDVNRNPIRPIFEDARKCMKQQGFYTSLQVWLYNKENTRKTYPFGYPGEGFGSLTIIDTSENSHTSQQQPMEDDEEEQMQRDLKSKRGNPASSNGKNPVGTLDGLSMLLYSGTIYASSLLYRKSDLKCGECWSVSSTIASSGELRNGERYYGRNMMIWSHHCCRSESKRGQDKEIGMEVSIDNEAEQEIRGRVGSFWIECFEGEGLPPPDTGKEDADPCKELPGKSYGGGYKPKSDLRFSNYSVNMTSASY